MAVAGVSVYFGAQTFGTRGPAPASAIPGEQKPWKVEVVNISGQDGLAQRVTAFLRSQGYDVVDFHSRQIKGQDRCAVVVRSAQREGAAEIAALFGLPEDRVVTQIDRSLFLDVSVVLGYDVAAFPVLRQFTNNRTTGGTSE